MTSLQLHVGGAWLATLGAWSDLTYSSTADGGCESASWSMSLPKTFSHPSLVTGKLVTIKAGSANVWQGLLNQPETTETSTNFTAVGLSSEADGDAGYIAFDASLNTTATPDVAIDQAIARGLSWTRPTSISSVPFGTDATDSLNYLGALLNAYATSVGQRWGVDENGAVYINADTTTPTWHMSPGSGLVGQADDDYASDLYLRYITTAFTYATVHVGDTAAAATRRREFIVDASNLGLTNSTAVTNVGNGMLAKGKSRYAWTAPLSPSRLQLTTPGGQSAYLPFVKAGDMVRLHGVTTSQGAPLPYFDFVVGRAEYVENSDTITLSPVQLAARSLGDILAVL